MKGKELKVVEMCREKMKGIRFTEETIKKNNNSIQRGLRIAREGANLGFIVYWADVVDMLGEEYAVEDAVGYIESMVQTHLDFSPDYSPLLDWDKAKGLLRCKVVNYERNKERLYFCPHMRYLDLAQVYYVQWELPGYGTATAEVNDGLVEKWGVTDGTVVVLARQNMEAVKYRVEKVSDILDDTERSLIDVENPLYALQGNATFGAAVIMNPGLVGKLTVGMGNLYILPSSVYELLVLPDNGQFKVEILRDTVRRVNRMQVKDNDFLSDQVYYFQRDSTQIFVCEEEQKVLPESSSMPG
ncbi:MAG: DUF5688 family protein [Lachnospiraceae bacterium]|nr:DUF5688 family protein [Lachnospiraceae bacterium]